MEKQSDASVTCFDVRAYLTKKDYEARAKVDGTAGETNFELARAEADSGQFSAFYQVEIASVGEDGTGAVVYQRFNPTLEERSLLVSALQRVERWLSGYGTTTQSDKREYVRETLKQANAQRG